MSAHVALDMNQIVVHLRRVATFFLYKKKSDKNLLSSEIKSHDIPLS